MQVVVCGVSGSGKSTVGTLLAERLGVSYADADDFHPEANRRKMAAGVPLTQADRAPWLTAIGVWLDARVRSGEPAVVTCSGLKRAHRDLLRNGRPSVRLVFLDVPAAVIEQRLSARRGHFFPRSLAASQLAELEPPGEGEPIVVVDATRPPAAVVADIVAALSE